MVLSCIRSIDTDTFVTTTTTAMVVVSRGLLEQKNEQGHDVGPFIVDWILLINSILRDIGNSSKYQHLLRKSVDPPRWKHFSFPFGVCPFRMRLSFTLSFNLSFSCLVYFCLFLSFLSTRKTKIDKKDKNRQKTKIDKNRQKTKIDKLDGVYTLRYFGSKNPTASALKSKKVQKSDAVPRVPVPVPTRYWDWGNG